MSLSIEQKRDWIYIPAPGRWDAFNFETSKTEIEQIATEYSQIAIDVTDAHFISIPMIKFIHSLAQEITRKGGRFALVGTTEKLKRQFHIFASLEPFSLYSQDNWEKYINTSAQGRA